MNAQASLTLLPGGHLPARETSTSIFESTGSSHVAADLTAGGDVSINESVLRKKHSAWSFILDANTEGIFSERTSSIFEREKYFSYKQRDPIITTALVGDRLHAGGSDNLPLRPRTLCAEWAETHCITAAPFSPSDIGQSTKTFAERTVYYATLLPGEKEQADHTIAVDDMLHGRGDSAIEARKNMARRFYNLTFRWYRMPFFLQRREPDGQAVWKRAQLVVDVERFARERVESRRDIVKIEAIDREAQPPTVTFIIEGTGESKTLNIFNADEIFYWPQIGENVELEVD